MHSELLLYCDMCLTRSQQVDIPCTELVVGQPITMVVHPKDGKAFEVPLQHTFNEAQIEWFKNGSALNTMAKSA